MKAYCLVCQKLTDNTNLKNVKNKGRLMMKSICLVCGNKKSRFILQGLNTPQNRIKNALWNSFRY